jgi:hypothetical protein
MSRYFSYSYVCSYVEFIKVKLGNSLSNHLKEAARECFSKHFQDFYFVLILAMHTLGTLNLKLQLLRSRVTRLSNFSLIGDYLNLAVFFNFSLR